MLEISVDTKFLNDLKYTSLKEMNIFKFLVLINPFFSLDWFKSSIAFSSSKCGFGNGLYEILPDEFK